mmetsp:Transcript_25072/g.54558  ORF Transcript_25072/g.54558 Transcript_25072/m.54558 type:complete len:362 (-) Transcript_25072:1359-2444(-)
MGEGGHELVVGGVVRGQLEEFEEGLQALQGLSLTAHHVVGQDVGGHVLPAVQVQSLQQLRRLLHRVSLEELQTLGIVVDLLRLSSGGRRSALGLLLLGSLSLLLVLGLLLRGGAHLAVVFISFWSDPVRFAPGLQIEKLEVDLDGVLSRASVELVRVELLLHAEHAHVGLEGGLAQAVVVEVKLILGHVGEVLKGLAEVLQSTTILLLPNEAASHVGFVPHALHVVQVASLWRVRFLREEESLLHTSLSVVQAEHGPHTLGVEIAICEIEASNFFVPLSTLHKVPSVSVDPALAGIDFDQSWGVLDGAIAVLQGLVRHAEEVEMIGQDHLREEQAGRGLLCRLEVRLDLLAHFRSEPRDLL